MGLAESRSTPARGANHRDPALAAEPAEPSVSASLAHLVSTSQTVITKRIDLALLEAQELVWRSIERAALAGLGMILGGVTWLAAAAALILYALPQPQWNAVLQLAAFALLNGVGALVFLVLAKRYGILPIAEWPKDHNERSQREPHQAGTRS